MRRHIIALVFLILAGALGAGWRWARSSPESLAALPTGIGLPSGQAQAAVNWAGGRAQAKTEPDFQASGSIEGHEVLIVTELGGRIVSLAVGEGDAVTAGQVLVELDTSTLLVQVEQAQAAVAAAQANLALVKAGTHPAQILVASAALAEAESERDAALVAWRDAGLLLDDPQETTAQLVQAEAAMDLATTQVEQAEAQLALAQAERDQYRAQGSSEEKWLYRVFNYQVRAAEIALEAARANKAGAQETVAALQSLRANPLWLVRQVHQAEAQYRIAVSGVAVAEAKLAELQAGPTLEEVGVAKAQTRRAASSASALGVQIEKMTLRSPIDGVVTGCPAHLGEAATAGTTLLKVTNLDEVKLTIYVPADELRRVYLGQKAEVHVDSFPGRPFAGTVCYISQEAEFTPKNIQTENERASMVYAVRLRLANSEHLLRPGMAADAILKQE